VAKYLGAENLTESIDSWLAPPEASIVIVMPNGCAIPPLIRPRSSESVTFLIPLPSDPLVTI